VDINVNTLPKETIMIPTIREDICDGERTIEPRLNNLLQFKDTLKRVDNIILGMSEGRQYFNGQKIRINLLI
jgi:hypothetical protein